MLNDRYDAYRTRWPAINATRETTSGSSPAGRAEAVPRRPRLGSGRRARTVRPGHPDRRRRRRSSNTGWRPRNAASTAPTPRSRRSPRRSPPTGRVDSEMIADLLACDPTTGARRARRSRADLPLPRQPRRLARRRRTTCPATSANASARSARSPPPTPATQPTSPRSRRCCRNGCPARRSRPASAPCGSRASDVTQFLVDTLGASPTRPASSTPRSSGRGR